MATTAIANRVRQANHRSIGEGKADTEVITIL